MNRKRLDVLFVYIVYTKNKNKKLRYVHETKNTKELNKQSISGYGL